jgi:hypothetical protein
VINIISTHNQNKNSPKGVEQSVMECTVKALRYVIFETLDLPCVSREGPRWHVWGYSGRVG